MKRIIFTQARYCLLALFVILLAGCTSTQVQVLLHGKLRDGGFTGRGPTATLRVQHYVNDRVVCEYEHISHIRDGEPFNNRDEDTLDHVGCGFVFGGRRQLQ